MYGPETEQAEILIQYPGRDIFRPWPYLFLVVDVRFFRVWFRRDLRGISSAFSIAFIKVYETGDFIIHVSITAQKAQSHSESLAVAARSGHLTFNKKKAVNFFFSISFQNIFHFRITFSFDQVWKYRLRLTARERLTSFRQVIPESFANFNEQLALNLRDARSIPVYFP